jgi:putative oxidoreductase
MKAQLRYLPAIGRLLIAAIFLVSGVGKIVAPEMTQRYIASVGMPAPLLAYLIAVLIEVGGGILLLVGLKTRSVALVMALYAIATALGFHTHFSDQNQMIHFLKDIAIAGGLLQVVAFGAGGFSLDNRRSGRSNRG